MRPLGTPRHRWEGNIMMNHREVDWIEMAQYMDRTRLLVNAVMDFWVP
jgi:hypothetical protein